MCVQCGPFFVTDKLFPKVGQNMRHIGSFSTPLFIILLRSACAVLVVRYNHQFYNRPTLPSTRCWELFKGWASPTFPPSFLQSRSSSEFGQRFGRTLQLSVGGFQLSVSGDCLGVLGKRDQPNLFHLCASLPQQDPQTNSLDLRCHDPHCLRSISLCQPLLC